MTFHIGSQTAGVINNFAGDQRISGGQQGQVFTLDDARAAVPQLRQAVASAGLDPEAAGAAAGYVDDIDHSLQDPAPDQHRVAEAATRLTELLHTAGAIAKLGATLVGPLHVLGSWLGALGVPILALL